MLIESAKNGSTPQHNILADGSAIPADFIPAEVEAAAAKSEELGRNDVPRRNVSAAATAKTEDLADTALLLTQNRLQRELSLASYYCEVEEQRVQRLNTDIAAVRLKAETATKDADSSPGSFNRWVGWLLLFAALVLILSDIPLSLQLVAKGLRIPSEARLVSEPDKPELYVRRPSVLSRREQQTWADASEKGEVISAGDLLRKPRVVSALFWDVYLLGLGVAFLGLALKPILDILLDGDKQSRLALWLSGIVLALFLSSTVVLGFFRSAVIHEELAAPFDEKLGELNSRMAAEKAKPPGDRNESEMILLQSEADDLNGRKQQALGSWWSTAAFILLTLALPLFGAVSFYYGCRKLDHTSVLKRLRQQLVTLESKRDEAWRQQAFWRSCRDSRERYRNELTADSRQSVRQRCAAMYESGLEKAREQRAAARRGKSIYEALEEEAYEELDN